MKQQLWYLILMVAVGLLFVFNLSYGAVKIPFTEVMSVLFGGETQKASWQYIILDYRMPKAIVAVLTGISLSVSGLLMQTLFRNPMAESYVLGVSSGAGLGVAFVIMGSASLPAFLLPYLMSGYSLVLVSVLGSMALLLIVLAVSNRVNNSVTVLIVGLMFGSFANAVVGILSYFSKAEQLKMFTLWASGSLGNLTTQMILIYAVVVMIGLLLVFGTIKKLDALLLGDSYATSLGVNVKVARNIIIVIASLLAGVTTAFVGPIAFVGLAVPHMARLLFRKSTHYTLVIACVLLGSVIMLLCDMLTQIIGDVVFPINAITAIFGAPIVVFLIFRYRFF